jgi:hypothetical protein
MGLFSGLNLGIEQVIQLQSQLRVKSLLPRLNLSLKSRVNRVNLGILRGVDGVDSCASDAAAFAASTSAALASRMASACTWAA